MSNAPNSIRKAGGRKARQILSFPVPWRLGVVAVVMIACGFALDIELPMDRRSALHEWWIRPVEVHPELRKPRFDRSFLAMATTTDAKGTAWVWFGGQGGMVARRRLDREEWDTLPLPPIHCATPDTATAKPDSIASDPAIDTAKAAGAGIAKRRRRGQKPNDVVQLSAAGSRIFALVRGGGVFYRDPADSEWREVRWTGNTQAPCPVERLSTPDSNTVLQLGDGQVWCISGKAGSWTRGPYGGSGSGPKLRLVEFVSLRQGLAVDSSDRLLATRDGGATWSEASPGFDGIHPQDETRRRVAWKRLRPAGGGGVALLGDKGAVALYDFPKRSFRWAKSMPQGFSAGVDGAFPSGSSAILADSSEGGTVAVTSDFGGKWTRSEVIARPRARVKTVFFVDPKHGFVAGSHMGVWETFDGGASWQRATRYQILSKQRYFHLPPPIFIVILLASIVLVLPAFRRHAPVVEVDIGGALVSDRPLEYGDARTSELAMQVNALVNFIRNPSTKPPMVFSVVGEWGKGKSSFLRMARNRLDAEGHPTVWFNAWHAQDEESLFATLMESIRKAELLGVHTFDGIQFRARLVKRRLKSQLPSIVLATGAAVLACMAARFALSFAGPDGGLRGSARQLVDWSPFLVGAVALWRTGSKVLGLFHTKPATLLAGIAGKARIGDLSKKVGFKEEFRREFNDVAESLEDKPLVVFIDDLDRSRPATVMAALEAVNFLVASGPCHFVIALDMEQVSCAIADQDKVYLERFKEERKSARAYALSYLQKLVQLELSVPEAGPDAFRTLLKGDRQPEPPSFWGRLPARCKRYLPVLLSGLLAFGGLVTLLSDTSEPPDPAAPATESVVDDSVATSSRAAVADSAKGADTAAKATAERDSNLRAENVPKPAPPKAESDSSYIAPASDPFLSQILPSVLCYACLAYVVFAFVAWRDRRARKEFADSGEFQSALEQWSELVHIAARTPRGAKAHLNRLRYFATIRREWKKREADLASAGKALGFSLIGDAQLVALSSLELAVRNLPSDPLELGMESLDELEELLQSRDLDRPDLAKLVKDYRASVPDWDHLLGSFEKLGARVNREPLPGRTDPGRVSSASKPGGNPPDGSPRDPRPGAPEGSAPST